MKDRFDISEIINLVSGHNKYEITDAAFAAIDRYEQLEVAKPMKKRKVSLQVLEMLARERLQFYYKDYSEMANAPLTPEEAEARLRAMPSGEDEGAPQLGNTPAAESSESMESAEPTEPTEDESSEATPAEAGAENEE